MNKEQNEIIPVILGAIGVIGFLYLISSDENPHRKAPRRPRREKNSFEDISLALEESSPRETIQSEAVRSLVETTLKGVSPSILNNSDSIKSLRVKYPSSERFLTSKKTFTSITPESVSCEVNIRKYPDEYYNLSKKAQWKYRKRSTCL